MENHSDAMAEDKKGEVKKNVKRQGDRRQQGKGSKLKAQEKFRKRTNEQEMNTLVVAYTEKLTLIDSKLENPTIIATLDRMTKPTVAQAVPLSVTSRSVGFACAYAYQRSTTTWDSNVVAGIMTIHQLYRVCIWLVYYKLFLAQREQNEECPGHHFLRLQMAPETEELLKPVMEVPCVISTILDSIGKVSTPHGLFHMGIPQVSADCDQALARSLLLYPCTMNEIITFLADPDPVFAEQRVDFIEHNSIPGARFEDNVLTNGDDIWPAVAGNHVGLADDLHAYKNWVTRVRNRLPRHFFVATNWSGHANVSGLWSCERLPLDMTSTFATVAAEPSRRYRNRAGVLQVYLAIPAQHRYLSTSFHGSRGHTFWTVQPTNEVSALIGCSTMVGENCYLNTRFSENGRSNVCHNPLQIICNICDAP